VEFKLITRF